MNDWQKVIRDIHNNEPFIGELNTNGLLVLVTTMIEVIRKDAAFNMYDWNGDAFNPEGYNTSFVEQHECGMAACLGGWTALHPTFTEMGGGVAHGGAPTLNGYDGYNAINELLGIDRSHTLGWHLTEPFSDLYRDIRLRFDDNDIKATDVLERLAYLVKLNNGEIT